MKNTQRSKAMLVLAIVLSVVMVATGTFAWFTAKDDVKNHFETKQITDGSVSIFEIFDEPDNWLPGQKVTKEVGVINNGETDVLIRLSFEEMMKVLKDQGKAKAYALGATLPAGAEPVLVGNVTTYNSAPWVAATAADCNAAIPPSVKIFKKTVVNSQTNVTTSSYFVYKELGGTPATYQKMTMGPLVEVSGNKVVDIASLREYYFDGYDTVEKDWAGTNLKVTDLPVVSPGATFVNTTAKTSPSYADSTLANPPYGDIVLHYDAIMATMTANNWFYNSADGYFYYGSILKPGELSANLLSKVELTGAAADEYANLSYDLFVLMDAIQNTKDAVTSSTGWNLPVSHPAYIFWDANSCFAN